MNRPGRDTLEAAKKAKIGVDEIQHSQRRDNILPWISSTDFPSKQSDIIGVRQKGTGQWFLKDPKFETWISGSKSTLMCLGMPGAGKTMVAAIAIDHLSRTIQNHEIGVAYIYCSYQSREVQSTTVLLGALLRQLVQARNVIPQSVLRLYEHHSSRGTKPSSDEILDTLQHVIGDFSNVYVVVDALDECLDAKNKRVQLLPTILDLQRKSEHLKLMLTSRFIPEIEEEFEHARLEVRASDDDVKRFIQNQMPELPKCVRGNKELASAVEDEIVNAADGMLVSRLSLTKLARLQSFPVIASLLLMTSFVFSPSFRHHRCSLYRWCS